MECSRKFFVATFLFAVLSVPTVTNAASVVYSYTGNNFNSFAGSAFNNTMFVSGYIEVNDFLAPNLVNQSVTPLTYSFTDGVNAITKSDIVAGNGADTLQFYTDASGNITMWDISIYLSPTAPSQIGDTQHQIRTRFEVTFFADETIDFGLLGTCEVLKSGNTCAVFNNSTGEVLNNRGSWSVQVVPIPPALYLFGSGLLGLIGVAKRKRSEP